LKKSVSILDVAQLAGVSKSTVSRVLNNSYGISENAKEKVLKAVEELKYRPNMSARHLRNNTNKQLGVLVPLNLSGDFMYQMNSEKIQSIVKSAKDIGYDILLFVEDTSNSEVLCNIIMEKGIAGILLLDTVPPEVLQHLYNYKIPYVQINWYISDYKNQLYVKTDLAKATIMALDVLISKGCTDIGLIQYEDRSMKDSVIVKAFTEYVNRCGLKSSCSIWNMDSEYENVEDFLTKTKKHAYISYSYPDSVRIIEYCRKNNIRIPQDLKLISYEFFEFFDYLHPKLTGIKQNGEEMGKKAVEKLVSLIEGNKNVESELISPKIVFRETC